MSVISRTRKGIKFCRFSVNNFVQKFIQPALLVLTLRAVADKVEERPRRK